MYDERKYFMDVIADFPIFSQIADMKGLATRGPEAFDVMVRS